METGGDNVSRFVRRVLDEAQHTRIVILRPDGARSGQWPWMENSSWRHAVEDRLAESDQVYGAVFHCPDSLDGWSFCCYSVDPKPKVAGLSLDDTLDGSPPTMQDRIKAVVHKSWKPICWYCIGALVVLTAIAVSTGRFS